MKLRMVLRIMGICSVLLCVFLFNKIQYSHSYIDYTYDIVLDYDVLDVQKKKSPLVEEPVKQEETVLYTLSGSLTGYAADCPMCNGTLACKRDYKVYKNGVTSYNDVTYGNVRIVASSKNLPCGSIIEFDSNVVNGTVYAIVLDRGVLGNNIDLLVESESYASKYIGRSNINYKVLREGW